MKKKKVAANSDAKRGVSPIVLLLAAFALIILILCVSLSPDLKNSNSPDKDILPPSDTQNDNNNTVQKDHFPSLPNNVITDDAYLSVEKIVLNFPSGGFVAYGYPSLMVSDTSLGDTVNTELKRLVDTVILPKANELLEEDSPGSERFYGFRLAVSQDCYSIIVTVDINEGITSDFRAFAWNFSKGSGKRLDLYADCNDRYALAKLIDSHITSTASYDPIIHTWITDVLTSDDGSEKLSCYFTDDLFVAVINERFRLNSPDRSPILIEIPYSEVKPLFNIR